MKTKEEKRLNKIIREQDRMIGELTRHNEYLSDSQRKRNSWLSEAKKEAGYPDSISFDRVWADALKALKESKK
jgi:hypothetical protein